MKEWVTAKEIAGIAGLSTHPSNVNRLARKEQWKFRKVKGVQGGGYEYAFSSLPQEVQAELLLKNAKETISELSVPTQCVKGKNYLPEVIWVPFDKATNRQKEVAQRRLAAVIAVANLIDNKLPLMESLQRVADEYNESVGSIKRWFYKVKKFERSDWLPLLIDKHSNKRKEREAEFTEQAWEFFKADYFRPERPQFGSCYERLKRAAIENAWVIPSISSLKRKIAREIPLVQQVYLREGEHALSQFYPALQRSVEDIEALEWINGDGYQHNVFVRWHNGEIVRPKTWIWQDVRTRKILAYRTDISENSDTIRLSLMDLVYKYGIPRKCTIDNTRAAANKWMTGGVKNRYRFKVKEDEVQGIIPLLGIELHWTSIQFGKGHGQAKPIERAFSHGGLGELIDKHPKLAGFFAGENIYNKPDNYNGGKEGVAYEDFIIALEDGIQTFNQREKRKTEICQGVYSFSQVFARDYANTQIRKASPEQMRLLMLMSEAVTLKKDGTFELSCGGKVFGRKNRYLATDLIGSHHKKVVIKFDPQHLHSTVYVYSLEGIFLAEATCTEKVAFGDKAAGREHDKARKQFTKANKAAAKAQQTMNAQQASRLMPELEIDDETTPTPRIIEMFQQVGNTVRKVEVNLEEDEISEFEQRFIKIKHQRG
ncbi:DDE endonuclease [Mergibacter septicus]|uniref:DDE endonuclease n=1 Tax=Mergibacter septicus TaxID=221402 RepID=A0A8D4IZ88_9PAST|nr:transposase domain-containing protein [Mergibacter septicus]AWX15209.1 DDE endonuclease [Mergibacter septicus]QDJ14463.1 DDE endonuclease [Mergibacter septicus]UTU48100.1 Mu transposase C-terminal domain-containing protein [Mergibacter septicus]WMR96287.1 transposase domain-containing protein [Mergibacter septicus]